MKQIVTNTIARAHIAISNTKARLVNLVRKEDGVTAVEYGIMVAIIAVILLVAFSLLGDSIGNRFSDVADAIDGAPDTWTPAP